MTVSSRTPEGEPHLCRICGELAVTEKAEPLGDSVCPRCGVLLSQLSDSLQSRIRLISELLGPDGFASSELDLDSLDTVELVLELEEELDIEIPDDEVWQARTVGEVIRLILKYKRQRDH